MKRRDEPRHFTLPSVLRWSIVMAAAVICASCIVPLPNHTVWTIACDRAPTNGAPAERIEQGMVVHNTFYPVGPEGMVTMRNPSRFVYFLVCTNGSRKELKFLRKKHVQADYFICFPISRARWLAVTSSGEDGREPEKTGRLDAIVFTAAGVIFWRTNAASLEIDYKKPYPGSPGWKPTIENTDYVTEKLRFDPKTELATFVRPCGDSVFDPNDGTLREATAR